MKVRRARGEPVFGASTRRAFLAAAVVTAVLAPTALVAAAAQPVQIPEPPPGKALIVFYRTWEYFDAAVSYIVREGKTELGLLSAGSYFVAVVDPGVHTYSTHAERRDDMQIAVEPDEIYYVRFELDLGVILYQPSLTPAEQRQFDQASPHLKLSAPLAPHAARDTPPTAL